MFKVMQVWDWGWQTPDVCLVVKTHNDDSAIWAFDVATVSSVDVLVETIVECV